MRELFYKHNAENERKVPSTVTRSSAVFYFKNSHDVKTEIHYLNYWQIKRGVSSIKRRVTFRSMCGEKLFCFEKDVTESGAHCLYVEEILKEFKQDAVEGSVEIEFFSEHNLHVAYPALVIRYVGESWHTVAHSSQRYLSEDSGDEVNSSIGEAEEGNLTLSPDKQTRAFFIVHNGFHRIQKQQLEIKIITQDGMETIHHSSEISSEPYETHFLYLDEIVDYHSLLDSRYATFSIKMNAIDVFPRLIGGLEKNGKMTIDHTNFASQFGEASLDVIDENTKCPDRSLVFNIPFSSQVDLNCYVDIYPSFPGRGSYELKSCSIQKDGTRINAQTLSVSNRAIERFNRVELPNRLINGEDNFEISIQGKENSKLPRRFHMGVHYAVNGGLPGFLTDGPIPHTTKGIRTRWFPVFEPHLNDNFIMISNRQLGSESASDIVFEARLFNSFSDDPISAKITIAKYKSISLSMNEIFDGADKFLNKKAGWVYLQSVDPQHCVVHYLSIKANNSVAVCHAF